MKLAVVMTTPEVQAPCPVALLSGSFTERLEKAVQLGYTGIAYNLKHFVGAMRFFVADRRYRGS